MRKILLLTTLLVSPAFAADLPKAVPIKATVGVTTPSSIYVFVHGGVGFTDVQNDIAITGIVVAGTPKLWPAGFMAGGGIGYLSTTSPIAFGVEAEGDYDFTRGAGADITGTVSSSSKNSWFFAEKALVGITLAQIGGYIPGSAQPQNWPVPITVPAGIYQNVMLLGVVGAAQRNVDLCATDVTSTTLCGSQWKNGFLTGAQARFAVSPNVRIRVEYDYVMFNRTFTAAPVASIFANTIAAKDEQRLMAGFDYNF